MTSEQMSAETCLAYPPPPTPKMMERQRQMSLDFDAPPPHYQLPPQHTYRPYIPYSPSHSPQFTYNNFHPLDPVEQMLDNPSPPFASFMDTPQKGSAAPQISLEHRDTDYYRRFPFGEPIQIPTEFLVN